ncbi:hypothetical protein P8452_50311 [Trifolium repens]|nr:hypothetical protein P8452_50311 [Trifolium repens]
MISDCDVALNMPLKIVPYNIVDVVLKHCFLLDFKLYGQDIVYCKHCNNVVPGGFYRFICHLTGMENVEVCERVGDEVRKEMLEFHTTLQEVNEKGNEVAVGSSRDSLTRRRIGSQAFCFDNKNEKTSREDACANPVVQALHLVNSIGKPAMGFIYEAMEKAKEEIQRRISKGDVESLMPLPDLIDKRWDKQLDSPFSYDDECNKRALEMVHAKRRLFDEDETDSDDVIFVMTNSKLADKKRAPIEQVIDDNWETLNV